LKKKNSENKNSKSVNFVLKKIADKRVFIFTKKKTKKKKKKNKKKKKKKKLVFPKKKKTPSPPRPPPQPHLKQRFQKQFSRGGNNFFGGFERKKRFGQGDACSARNFFFS